ncbi:hypothetical protein PIB30_072701, partial [Stylosanthes scabra]|nr:hypothetical protein [Stylosanthes scabra]
MPKPPYPQRLKAENKNKAPKKEPKEEKDATHDSVKFQQIQSSNHALSPYHNGEQQHDIHDHK